MSAKGHRLLDTLGVKAPAETAKGQKLVTIAAVMAIVSDELHGHTGPPHEISATIRQRLEKL